MFSEWDYKLHTCAPFPIPAEWEVWRGADDGYAAPACVLWLAHDDIYDRVYVVTELYESGMTPEVIAGAVLRIDRSIPVGLGVSGGKGSRADIMNSYGCRWKPSEKGVGSRLAGIAAIHGRLALKSDGRPGLVVFNTCRNLIPTLPAMVYSRTNPEDIDDICEQHAVDALRYG